MLLLVLFAGSGFSALVYEIVWYQLLQLVIGSTAISLALLLATFMGGLCLGSLLALPRVVAARRYHPLRVYAFIEMGIGICGMLVLAIMPLVDREKFMWRRWDMASLPFCCAPWFAQPACCRPPC